MKKVVLGLFLIIGLSFIPLAKSEAYVSVKGYFKKDGTYVQPHVRSEPNGIKYDNYGYKPNQGLLNDSYGTRDTAWDTPTYVTDPDYYTGKNLYESKSNTPSCPLNSYPDTLNNTCKCNYGYVASGSSCVNGSSVCYNKYGLHSSFDSINNSCGCSTGYRWNTTKTSCISNTTYCTNLFGYGAEYSYLDSTCACRSGYEFDGSTCAVKKIVNCPLHTTRIGDSCYCDSGYTLNTTQDACILLETSCQNGLVNRGESCITHTQNCQSSFGENSFGLPGSKGDSTCYCTNGFEWNLTQTTCVLSVTVPPPAIKLYAFPTVATLNIRTSSSTLSAIAGKAKKDTRYEILEQGKGEWLKILYQTGKSGWVMKKYVKIK